MATRFGILLPPTHFNYRKATSVEQLVVPYLRKVIESLEGKIIPQGKLMEAVQEYVNGYGESTVENQFNDNGIVKYPIVSFSEVAYHLSYQGWITKNDRSIDNGLHAQMLVDWMERKGIQDYDGTAQAQALLEEDNKREDKEIDDLTDACCRFGF